MATQQRNSATTRTAHADLYDQPGHLLRRAHQISQGMFDACVGTEVTPLQYAILRMVHEVPGIDQVGLARHVALDNSTTASTAARLEAKGLLRRETVEHNRRQLSLTLTPAGEELLGSLVAGVRRMRREALAALEPQEQEIFMDLLRKFVRLNNLQSRAPLDMSEAETEATHKVRRRKA